MYLSDLAVYVDVSRKKIKKELIKEFDNIGVDIEKEKIEEITEKRLEKEIEESIQTLNYQINTMNGSNGQSPFLSIFIYLDDPDYADNKQVKEDTALLAKEVFKQRIKGFKNESGFWVAPTFPKLIYVLDEDNIHNDSKYYWLTELAAKCTSKRMVPDYISAKVMKELKQGDVYGVMGCVDGEEVIDYKLFGKRYVESFSRAWYRTGLYFEEKIQKNGKDNYRDLKDTYIWDNKEEKYVGLYKIIKNKTDEWLELSFSNGRQLDTTLDHPFEIEGKGMVYANDLTKDDKILVDHEMVSSNEISFNKDLAWALGLLLCDSSYDKSVILSLGLDENDIVDNFSKVVKENLGLDINIKEQSRGKKGNYLDVSLIPNEEIKIRQICDKLISLFGGSTKVNRKIPDEVYDWSREARLSFLAGIIDADGYINNNSALSKVQVGSTNKELSIQQMLLAQSLGMRASIYRNHYNSKDTNKIRYRVEFVATEELGEYIISEKKRKNIINVELTNKTIKSDDYCSLINKRKYNKDSFSYDVTTESEHFTVSGMYSHNCRSALTPDPIHHKYKGRFNQQVVTLNLPDVALSSGGDINKFWDIFEHRMDIVHRALKLRTERLKGTKSDVAPILWQHGALARLEKGETIDELLYNNYSTSSIGYAGLYETVKYMTGLSHTDKKAKDFALSVLQFMNDKAEKWREEENISYSIYGTPLESTSGRLAEALKKRFGEIENITDKDFVTNSYHVPVFEEINAFDKLSFESEFQELTPGGSISYIEAPNMEGNIEGILSVIKFIYDNIMYAEINMPIDHCNNCGSDLEIPIIRDEEGKRVYECRVCGERDNITVIRRVCGYLGNISKNGANQGRLADIEARVLHLK
jgi:anaerobic ribonucleoside-triphosphate reductase